MKDDFVVHLKLRMIEKLHSGRSRRQKKIQKL